MFPAERLESILCCVVTDAIDDVTFGDITGDGEEHCKTNWPGVEEIYCKGDIDFKVVFGQGKNALDIFPDMVGTKDVGYAVDRNVLLEEIRSMGND